MANISGVRTTANITQDRRVVDMADQIALLDPNETPFITILKKVIKDRRKVYNPEFKWTEDDLTSVWGTVNGTVTDSATSVTLDDASFITVGDILRTAAGEQILVTAINGNALTVTRGYGTTAAASIADDSNIAVIGNAHPENGTAATAITTKEDIKSNYTQIFKTSVALSGTEMASKLYGGKDLAYQRRKKAIEHKRDICRALYFGEKKEDTSGITPRRTMAGAVSLIGVNNTVTFASSSGIALTEANFNQYVALPAFNHGSSEKLLIAGPELINAVDGWYKGKLALSQVGVDKTFGVNVRKLITSYGILDVIYEPLFTKGFAGFGLVIDPANIRYAYLEGRDTKLETNIQANDVDGEIDQYLTECSLELKLPSTHLVIKGAYF